jgi:hypothetical protein
MKAHLILALLVLPVRQVVAYSPSFKPASCKSSHAHLCNGLQDRRRRNSWERTLVQFQCRMFVASWTGVVRYHGPRPVNRPNNVWVCNHTSMIDYIILTSYSPFAVIMQLHAGWIAFIQTRVLSCLGCLWFNRNEARSFLVCLGCVMQGAC